MKTPYNGHESWNAWNVALWIGNDEGLYRCAIEALRTPRKDGKPVSDNLATLRFFENTGLQNQRTPDGARYSHRSVKLAIKGYRNE
jgi:hypothetical protein